jgi:lipoprotein-anchoring transpeptidase ErfK/SrfK
MLAASGRVIAGLAIIVAFFVTSPASRAGEVISFNEGRAGTILVKTSERRLYLILGNGKAIRYVVGVGRSGLQWLGTTSIVSKHVKPAWTPPADMRGSRGAFIIESGAPNNPMGAAALVLADHELAIHGTNNPGSIGGFVSSGCIRMHNADITDLFDRVSVGTPVVIAR